MYKWNTISPTWILRPFGDDSPQINHDFQGSRTTWGRDEIYPDGNKKAMDPSAVIRTYGTSELGQLEIWSAPAKVYLQVVWHKYNLSLGCGSRVQGGAPVRNR